MSSTSYILVGVISDNPNLIEEDLKNLAKETRELAVHDIILYRDEFYYIGQDDISPVNFIFSVETYSLI